MSVLMEERCRRDEAMQCKAGKSQQSQARFGGKEKENWVWRTSREGEGVGQRTKGYMNQG